MRILIRKSCQIALAIFISCAATYGIGYTISECCNELVDSCFQASEKEQGDVAFGTRCRTPLKAQPSQCEKSVGFTDCCNTATTCCIAEGFDSTQTVYLNPTPSQYPINANAIFKVVGLDINPKKDPNQEYTTLVTHSNTPLYIQIESILC